MVFHPYCSPGALDGQSATAGLCRGGGFSSHIIFFFIVVLSGGAAAPSAPLVPAAMPSLDKVLPIEKLLFILHEAQKTIFCSNKGQKISLARVACSH